MKKNKITFRKIRAYITGHFRYKLYYSRLKFLIPKHILEQIETRINSMNTTCYKQGSCVKCGCETTALQMSKKACEGDCYPDLAPRKVWKLFKKVGPLHPRPGQWGINKELNEFIKG